MRVSRNPPVRVLVYDATRRPKFGVERTWAWGAKLFGKRFDVVVAATSWEQVLSTLEKTKQKFGPGWDVHVQFWGHGWYGRAFIGNRSAPARDPRWGCAHTVWFRTCLTAGGVDGAAFMWQMSQNGCRVAAHTVVVGSRLGAQSYLYGLMPGDIPSWPETPDHAPEVQPGMRTSALPLSSPLSPRTVMFWNMDLPDWVWDATKRLTA